MSGSKHFPMGTVSSRLPEVALQGWSNKAVNRKTGNGCS
jgi:hypothetical protein